MAWLHERPELIETFSRRLVHVCADELSLVRETNAIVSKKRKYIQRCFVFGGEYVAVLEWNHAGRSVHVHEIQRMQRPRPAA